MASAGVDAGGLSNLEVSTECQVGEPGRPEHGLVYTWTGDRDPILGKPMLSLDRVTTIIRGLAWLVPDTMEGIPVAVKRHEFRDGSFIDITNTGQCKINLMIEPDTVRLISVKTSARTDDVGDVGRAFEKFRHRRRWLVCDPGDGTGKSVPLGPGGGRVDEYDDHLARLTIPDAVAAARRLGRDAIGLFTMANDDLVKPLLPWFDGDPTDRPPCGLIPFYVVA